MDSNCFTLLELLSTAQRTEAQLLAMKYVSVKQSIFIKSCKPRQECSKCSKSSERCTRRAARVRAKVRVLNLTTLLTAREHNTQICGQQLFRSVRAPQHSFTFVIKQGAHYRMTRIVTSFCSKVTNCFSKRKVFVWGWVGLKEFRFDY